MPSGTKASKHFKTPNLHEVQLPTVCKHVVASFSIPDVSTQAVLAQETSCSELLSNVSRTMRLFFLKPSQLIGAKMLAVLGGITSKEMMLTKPLSLNVVWQMEGEESSSQNGICHRIPTIALKIAADQIPCR